MKGQICVKEKRIKRQTCEGGKSVKGQIWGKEMRMKGQVCRNGKRIKEQICGEEKQLKGQIFEDRMRMMGQICWEGMRMKASPRTFTFGSVDRYLPIKTIQNVSEEGEGGLVKEEPKQFHSPSFQTCFVQYMFLLCSIVRTWLV